MMFIWIFILLSLWPGISNLQDSLFYLMTQYDIHVTIILFSENSSMNII